MKKLLFIVVLLPTMAWGQDKNHLGNLYKDGNVSVGTINNNPLRMNFIPEKPIDEQYLDWCNADSNKVLVGYSFIISDRKLSPNSWASQDFYNPQYRALFVKDNPDVVHFVEGADWSDPEHVWYVAHMREPYANKYYEVEPIKRRIEPTFEGFIRWKKRFNKQEHEKTY